MKSWRERVFGPWMDGADPATLRAAIEARGAELAGLPPGVRVLLAEPEPRAFAHALAAAATSDAPVRLFLGTHRWGREECGVIARHVGPELVWGDLGPFPGGGRTSIGPAEQTLLMVPTGGTTGGLRFAIHTLETLAAAAEGLQAWLGGGPVHSVCFLPLHHVSGLMQVVRAWVSGGTTLFASWAEIEAGHFPAVRPEGSVASIVPTQLARIIALPGGAAWLRRFQVVFLGGAGPWPSLLEQARAEAIPLAPCYGMTETAAQVASVRPEVFLSRDGVAGEPLPHASIDIVGASPGQPGRIRVRSRSLFRGYWPGDPREMAEFVTDDLGTMDANGRLRVLGRVDAIINSGGEKINPMEIEAAIRATGLVDDVAVCGLPDSDWGEVVVAVVAGLERSVESGLRERLRVMLAPHKVPKRFVPADALPRNALGKIDRRALTALASAGDCTG